MLDLLISKLIAPFVRRGKAVRAVIDRSGGEYSVRNDFNLGGGYWRRGSSLT
jgi:hypothetical protein